APGGGGGLFGRLGGGGGGGGRVGPPMARRAFGSNVADAGGSPDEVQVLLGHKHPDSAGPYRFPDPGRVRAAVERVPSPRLPRNGERSR
ncbi:recombinase XerD, partial [Kitasatospora aureofaciens]